MLWIIALVNPLSNARFVYISALRGAGDSRFAAVVTFIGVILIRPVISFGLISPSLPFQMGLAGVWIGLSSDGVICFVMSLVRYMRGKWVFIKV
jgi:Na+-driven multidrug efflux pump